MRGARAAATAAWLLAGAAAFLGAGLGWPTDEDAFIYFRYALHSARGLGLVFNPGERVEGFSSALWMAALAAGAHLGAQVHALARGLGVLCTAAAVVAAERLGRAAGLGPRWRVGASACLAIDYWFLVWGQSGLETPLYALLLVVGATAYLRAAHSRDGSATRLEWAGLAGGAAALGRPEGALLGLAMLADQVLRGAPPRRVARLVWPALAMVAPYTVWRWLYFGAWLPNTSVKVYPLHADRSLPQAWQFVLFLGVLAPLLALLALRRKGAGADGAPGLRWLAASGLALSFGFHLAVGGDYRPWGFRYLVPALPLLLVAAWGAAERVTTRPMARRALAGLLPVALLAASIASWLRDPWRVWSAAAVARQWRSPGGGVDPAGGTAGWILSHVPEGSLVAYGQMGRVPYLCAHFGRDVRFLDTVGLVDRGVADIYRLDRKLADSIRAVASGESPIRALDRGRAARVSSFVAYVLARDPDYIVIEPHLQHPGVDALLASGELRRRYRLVAAFPSGDGHAERIFRRHRPR